MGFPTTLRQWLREARAGRLFADLRSRDGFLADYLDLAQVDGLIERHRSGFEDATDRIWRLLNLQIWGQMFLGAAGEPSRLEASVRTGNALET